MLKARLGNSEIIKALLHRSLHSKCNNICQAFHYYPENEYSSCNRDLPINGSA